MAKNKIEIDVRVDDKNTTKKLGLESKKTAKNLNDMGRGAQTADRNLKGAARTSSSGTKNFSKMAQGAGGLVGAYATLAASAFAVSAAFNFLKSAADFSNLIAGQKALGAVTGVAYQSISNSIVDATNGQLKYADAAKAAAIGTASGISPSQLTRLGAAAKNASLALGRDLGDSFDRLIRGVTKAEPELLDELGIILRLENATRKYGLEIGKSKDELNEFERSQAVANEVLSQAERKFSAMEKMMPANANALNQFAKSFDDIINSIKTGIAGPLASIATFLSQNMLALSGAVALFAGGLLKQILPSMAAWKQSSIDNRTQIIRDQKAIGIRLDRTKEKYAKLQAARINDTVSATKASAKIVSGTTGGTKSGSGALDFLAGRTDSKKSAAAAKKAIAHANKQIADGATKRTGILRNANKQQVADLQRSYEIRSGIYKRGMDDVTFQLNRAKLGWKSTTLTIKASISTIKVAMAGLASFAAGVGRLIGKAFFWVSMLSIAYDGVKTLMEYLYPTSEATKKLETRTEELTEKYKVLREEIERTIEVMKDYTMLTSSEMAQTRGKTVASLDIPTFMLEMNEALDLYGKGFIPPKMYDDMMATANAAYALDEGFGVLGHALEKGEKITLTSMQSMKRLDNELQNIGMTISQMPSHIQAMNTEFTKLVGTMNKPFGANLLTATDTVIKSQAVSFNALRKEYLAQDALLADFRRKNNLDPKTGEPKKYKDYKPSELVESEYPLLPGQDTPTMVIPKSAIPSQETLQDHAKRTGQLAEELKIIKELRLSYEDNVAFKGNLVKKQGELNKLGTDQVNAQVKMKEMLTQGIGLADKQTNIRAMNLALHESTNDEQQAVIVLEAKELTLLDKEGKARANLSDTQKLTLNSVRVALKLARGKVRIATADRDLALNKNKITIKDLEIQDSINKQMKKRLQLTRDVSRATLALKNIQQGGTGLYGVARGFAAATAQRDLLGSRKIQGQQAVTDTKSTFDKENTRSIEDGYDAEKVQKASDANKLAQQRLDSVNQEIKLFGQRAEIMVLNSKAETEFLVAQNAGLSMNPAVTAYNTAINLAKKDGIELSAEQQLMLQAEITAQTLLTDSLQRKQEMMDGVSSSISTAFISIVDGTASVKQAFASMAQSILQMILKMLVEMMILRTMMSVFGMAAPGMGASDGASQVMHNPNAHDWTARSGGIFSPQGKLAQGYATGGVARGSTSGYPVTMHGTEAVVPLPNGKSIPVEMKNSGGTNNNIVVNISSDGQSNTRGSSGPDMDKMGNAVAMAVQAELQNQKRSGGILNPYGVA